jgi:hypothetical protein
LYAPNYRLFCISAWCFTDRDILFVAWQKTRALEDLHSVQKLMSPGSTDPRFRFIYIPSTSSRDPLACSKEQLKLVLSHQEVMVSFLEHVFTFCSRDDPHKEATFRSEDYLDMPSKNVDPDLLTKMEPRIQHCFNLVGVEYDPESSSEQFKYRQTAAYYSLNLVSGKAFSLILKANPVVRNSIEEYTEDSQEARRMESTQDAFAMIMNTQLLIFEWMVQNWDLFINHLEDKLSRTSTVTHYSPVSEMTADPALLHTILRRGTTFDNPPREETLRQRVKTRSFKRWGPEQPKPPQQQTAQQNLGAIEMKDLPTKGHDMSNHFTFDKLQSLYRQDKGISDGLSVLSQNKEVLQDMMNHFGRLVRSKKFRHHVDVDEDIIHKFIRTTKRCIREVEKHESRLTALQTQSERVISLVSESS